MKKEINALPHLNKCSATFSTRRIEQMHGGAAKLKVEREWSRYQNDREPQKYHQKLYT